MQNYYSPSKRIFFNDQDHKVMPDDVMPVSEADMALLFQQQDSGKQIIPGPTGYPVAADNVQTPQELWAAYQRIVQGAYDASTDAVLTHFFENGVPIPDAWKAYRAQLRAILAEPSGTPGTIPQAPALT